MAKASVLDRPNIHRNTRVGLKVPASRQNVIQPDDDSDRTSECSGLRLGQRGVRFTWVFWVTRRAFPSCILVPRRTGERRYIQTMRDKGGRFNFHETAAGQYRRPPGLKSLLSKNAPPPRFCETCIGERSEANQNCCSIEGTKKLLRGGHTTQATQR